MCIKKSFLKRIAVRKASKFEKLEKQRDKIKQSIKAIKTSFEGLRKYIYLSILTAEQRKFMAIGEARLMEKIRKHKRNKK